MKNILCLLGLFLSMNGHTLAQGTSEIEYVQQTSEQVLIQDTKEVTLYKTEYVDSTCSRQEPYEATECGNETQYRNECSWVPGENICRTVNERQCRDVRRTRRECTAGRTRRECTNEPARRVCRTRNGVERCTDVPGRQHCRDVAGPQTCRNVPYTERECNNVPRRQCDWVEGRDVCSQVAYQEYICRDVTRYRTVSYACQKPIQVPYTVNKSFTQKVNFKFTDASQIGKATIKLEMDSTGEVNIDYINKNKSESYMQLLKSNEEVISDSETEKVTEKNIEINFGDLKKLTSPLNVNQKSLWMNKGGDFKLKLDSANSLINSNISIRVTKRSNGDLHFSRTFKLEDFDTSNSTLEIDLARHGFDQLKGFLGKKVKLKVEISIEVEKPTNLLVPIDVKFKKSKSFNIEVSKN